MSTRAVIARKTDAGFTGVYHHWDGYPSGLGKTLFTIHKTHFNKDTDKMLKVLIDAHRNGWSTINSNWSLEPQSVRDVDFVGDPPKYYPENDGDGEPITQENASGSGCEYAYVFEGDTMKILSSFCAEGEKMIGMFGMGDPKAIWQEIEIVNLAGDIEPDWEKL